VIARHFISHNIASSRPPTTIHERLDVNEHLLTASSGGDEAEASIIVPVRYPPIVPHNGSS
jgi:hypothetical protein